MTVNRKIILWTLMVTACIALSIDLAVAGPNYPSKRVLQSARELAYPPFSIVKPDGTADGFSVDLLKAVVEAVDLEVEISVGPWNEIKQQLAEGRLDVLPLVGYSQDRDKVFEFTVPYLQMHGTIFVRKGDNRIHNETDLKGKEVLVMRGDNSHEYAIANNLTDKLIVTTTFEEAMKLLSSGKHDAVLCQYLMGLQLIKMLRTKNIVSVSTIDEQSLKPKTFRISGFEQKFCLAVPEGRKELLGYLNEGLSIVYANGTYDALYEKWFGPILPNPSIPLILIVKSALLIIIPILLVLSLIGLWPYVSG